MCKAISYLKVAWWSQKSHMYLKFALPCFVLQCLTRFCFNVAWYSHLEQEYRTPSCLVSLCFLMCCLYAVLKSQQSHLYEDALILQHIFWQFLNKYKTSAKSTIHVFEIFDQKGFVLSPNPEKCKWSFSQQRLQVSDRSHTGRLIGHTGRQNSTAFIVLILSEIFEQQHLKVLEHFLHQHSH